ncbi:unnamed protein product [Prorocentrum cordatum]|uniref:Reverse transcriptase domain-containing protein n=1 Tax=Prorocentrum cordatum TaxID=2364126 RepID=A0ABN9T8I7_9DINO|nr:unnamed protein product [Polarella glacialis]
MFDGTGLHGVWDVLDREIGVKNVPASTTLPWALALFSGMLVQVGADGAARLRLGTGSVGAAETASPDRLLERLTAQVEELRAVFDGALKALDASAECDGLAGRLAACAASLRPPCWRAKARRRCSGCGATSPCMRLVCQATCAMSRRSPSSTAAKGHRLGQAAAVENAAFMGAVAAEEAVVPHVSDAGQSVTTAAAPLVDDTVFIAVVTEFVVEIDGKESEVRAAKSEAVRFVKAPCPPPGMWQAVDVARGPFAEDALEPAAKREHDQLDRYEQHRYAQHDGEQYDREQHHECKEHDWYQQHGYAQHVGEQHDREQRRECDEHVLAALLFWALSAWNAAGHRGSAGCQLEPTRQLPIPLTMLCLAGHLTCALAVLTCLSVGLLLAVLTIGRRLMARPSKACGLVQKYGKKYALAIVLLVSCLLAAAVGAASYTMTLATATLTAMAATWTELGFDCTLGYPGEGRRDVVRHAPPDGQSSYVRDVYFHYSAAADAQLQLDTARRASSDTNAEWADAITPEMVQQPVPTAAHIPPHARGVVGAIIAEHTKAFAHEIHRGTPESITKAAKRWFMLPKLLSGAPISEEVQELAKAARPLPLTKTPTRIRPMNLASPLRRLASKAVNKMASDEVAEGLRGKQCGCKHTAGAELVHKHVSTALRVRPDYAVLFLGAADAFQNLSRVYINGGIDAHCPKLRRWARGCLPDAGQVVYHDTGGRRRMWNQTTGIFPGCGMATALFCLGLDRALERAKRQLDAAGVQHELFGYVDDLTILAKPEDLPTIYAAYTNALSQAGLQARVDKCEVWARDPAAIPAGLPAPRVEQPTILRQHADDYSGLAPTPVTADQRAEEGSLAHVNALTQEEAPQQAPDTEPPDTTQQRFTRHRRHAEWTQWLRRTQTEPHQRAWALSATGKGAGAWLGPPARPDHHLADAHFRMAVRHRLGGLVRASDGPCPFRKEDGTLCAGAVDTNGRHALCCSYGGFAVKRRNNLRDTIARTLREAGIRDIAVEPWIRPPTGPGNPGLRADLGCTDSDGQWAYLDLAIVHPASQQSLQAGGAHAQGTAARLAEQAKRRKCNGVAGFQPLGFEVSGAMGESTRKWLAQQVPEGPGRLGTLSTLHRSIATCVVREASQGASYPREQEGHAAGPARRAGASQGALEAVAPRGWVAAATRLAVGAALGLAPLAALKGSAAVLGWSPQGVTRDHADHPAPGSSSPRQRIARQKSLPDTRASGTWKNRVPKSERLSSLQAHLEHSVMQQVRTDRWRGMPLVPLLQELERQVEEANPGEGEERVSFLCHRRLRKLAAALELGWELELLGPDAGERVGEEYGQAVGAQRSAIWHQEAMASAIQALRDAGASRILDIGSSYNPLQGEFPEVTAVDLVPAGPSVLQADFLEVPLRDGIQGAPTAPAACARLWPGQPGARPGVGEGGCIHSWRPAQASAPLSWSRRTHSAARRSRCGTSTGRCSRTCCVPCRRGGSGGWRSRAPRRRCGSAGCWSSPSLAGWTTCCSTTAGRPCRPGAAGVSSGRPSTTSPRARSSACLCASER